MGCWTICFNRLNIIPNKMGRERKPNPSAMVALPWGQSIFFFNVLEKKDKIFSLIKTNKICNSSLWFWDLRFNKSNSSLCNQIQHKQQGDVCELSHRGKSLEPCEWFYFSFSVLVFAPFCFQTFAICSLKCSANIPKDGKKLLIYLNKGYSRGEVDGSFHFLLTHSWTGPNSRDQLLHTAQSCTSGSLT